MEVPNPIYRHISSYCSHISSYSFIFFTYSYIYFRHISSYFWLTPSYIDIFLHISTYSFIFPSYLLHQGILGCDVASSRGERGGCTRESWNYLPGLEIFPNPLDIIPNMTSSGGVYSQILILPSGAPRRFVVLSGSVYTSPRWIR